MDTFLGQEINVALHFFIIAQVMGVFTIFFDFLSYQFKDRRKYLLVFSIGSTFWMLMFIFLGSVTLALVAAFSVLRSMVWWWIFAKDTPERQRAGKIFLYVALLIGLGGAIFSVINAPSETMYLHIITLVTALLFVVGQYLPSKHYVRVFAIFYALAVLAQTWIEDSNFMGVIIEASKIISIIVFYILLSRKAYFKRKLEQLKALINSECEKLERCNEQGILAEEADGILSPAQLEKMVARMIRLELATIDTEKLTGFESAELETKAALASIQSLSDVKRILERAIEIKDENLSKISTERKSYARAGETEAD